MTLTIVSSLITVYTLFGINNYQEKLQQHTKVTVNGQMGTINYINLDDTYSVSLKENILLPNVPKNLIKICYNRVACTLQIFTIVYFLLLSLSIAGSLNVYKYLQINYGRYEVLFMVYIFYTTLYINMLNQKNLSAKDLLYLILSVSVSLVWYNIINYIQINQVWSDNTIFLVTLIMSIFVFCLTFAVMILYQPVKPKATMCV